MTLIWDGSFQSCLWWFFLNFLWHCPDNYSVFQGAGPFPSSIVCCYIHSHILALHRSSAVLELSHLHSWTLKKEPSTLRRNWPPFWMGSWLVIWVLSPSLVPYSYHFGACMQPPNRLAFRRSSSDMQNWCNDSSLRACLLGVVMRVKASDSRFKGAIFTDKSGKQHFIFSFWWGWGIYLSCTLSSYLWSNSKRGMRSQTCWWQKYTAVPQWY